MIFGIEDRWFRALTKEAKTFIVSLSRSSNPDISQRGEQCRLSNSKQISRME